MKGEKTMWDTSDQIQEKSRSPDIEGKTMDNAHVNLCITVLYLAHFKQRAIHFQIRINVYLLPSFFAGHLNHKNNKSNKMGSQNKVSD